MPLDLLASVIVPVRGKSEDLRGLLAALSSQTVASDRFEVIIGDDGSRDGSIAALHDPRQLVRVATGPPANSYCARNRAAALAQAPALAFCDADCIPEPEWLEAGLEALRFADIAAGLVRFVVSPNRTVWTLLDVDTYLDQERAVNAGRAATANLFVRRALFELVGGFDDTLPNTSDYDFVSRCVATGAQLEFERHAVVRHPSRDEARAFLGKTWAVNRRYAEREGRAGRRPNALKLREWVPIVQPVRSRRRHGRSLTLDRSRLRANEIRPTVWEDARALPLMYLVLPYVAGAGQAYGWWRGRRLK